MERLKVLGGYCARTISFLFTFQYGEIKSITQRQNVSKDYNLHSSMERLKVVPAWLLATERHIFTFQYGEIKSNAAAVGGYYLIRFTFQYGEIKSL